MSIWLKRAVLAAATVVLVGGTGIGLSQAQGDPIAARKELYKANGGAMRAIKAAVDANGPATAVVPEAGKLVNTFKNVTAHYPAGSDKGETKASPEIWKNMTEFLNLNSAALAQATKLEATAKGGDMKLVAADFGDMGKACGACHDKFRLK
jgi:cytochrome c556